MDADRFDRLTRGLGAPASRRAALGATLAGGLLSALGLAKAVPEASAAQGGTCTLAFAANVRLGPGLNQPLSAEGQPGALQGNLLFGLDQSGRLTGELQAASGERFPVVGQATGYSLQARIELAPRVALVVVGVGEQEIAACRGAIDGMLSGPQVGDLGDWHAAASGGGGGRQGGGQNGDNTGRGGRSDRGGGGGRNNNQGSDAAADGAVTGGNSGGNRGNNRGGGQANQGGGGGRANQGGSGDSGGNGNGNGSGGGGRGQAATQQGACAADEVFCEDAGGGGFCAHLATNISNCGACGNGCDDSREFCQGGICVSKERVAAAACPPNEVFCFLEDGYCADLATDFLNCGLCGYVCATDEDCRDSVCVPRGGETGAQCADGLTDCNGTCADISSDNANCSACGIACPAGEECRGSLCVPAGGGGGCKTGFVPCGTTCVDPVRDNANCGGCGIVCEAGTICEDGECTTPDAGCLTGLMDCGGVCIDPGFDNANCGGCGLACAAGTTCVIGACIPEGSGGGGCKTGLTGCGGVCVDLNTDPANCGGCGFGCVTEAICQFGTCTPTTTEAPPPLTCADQGLIDCFGICVDLQSDPSNCGYCGEVCASGQCATGICVEVVGPAPAEVVCPTGQADCGGGCIDVFTDPANCGFCGNVCAADQQCLLGGCSGGIDLGI